MLGGMYSIMGQVNPVMPPLSVRLVPALVLGLLMPLWGCGSGPRAEERPTAPRGATDSSRPKIVVLGDSLTAGLGLHAQEAFPALLQQRVGSDWEVVNAGVSGDTTAGGLRRVDWALDGDVRILIVALGANDGLRGLPIAGMRRNLEAIVERAAARRIAILLAGMEAPPNFGAEYTASYRQAFLELSGRPGIVFVPFLLEGVAGETRLNQPDGIHPNADGARRVADNVWAKLQPMMDAVTSHD